MLLLDHLQDPQNVATLLRTAEALGVDGVVMPAHRAAGVTPAVVNASAGAVEHLRIVQETNLVRAMQALQEAGLWLAGVELAPGAKLYVEADLTGPLGLVVGSEGEGMSRLVRETCDFLIYLPMAGKVNSLNAAVAGSVALYEVWRQRAQAARG
jgi:23S rRNA (guanosine2251-2'-O)-methyltransferase